MTEMPAGGMDDLAYALRFREWIEMKIREALDDYRPLPRFGKVQNFNRFTGTATVILQGDTEPTMCKIMPSVEPTSANDNNFTQDPNGGDIVRVEGRPGSYWVTGIIGGREFSLEPNLFQPRIWGGNFLHVRALKFTTDTVGLPAVGNTWHVGRWDNSVSFASDGNGFIEIEIQWLFFTNQIKRYLLPMTQNYTNSSWMKVVPFFDSGPFNDNDFQLEIMCDASGYELRVRRTQQGGGFAPGGFDIRQWQYMDDVDSVPGSGLGEQATTEPTRFFGTFDTQRQKGFSHSPMVAAPMLSQVGLHGGGKIGWDGNTLSWSVPFRTTILGNGYNIKDGFFAIAQPANGTGIAIYGTSLTTGVFATPDGIPLTGNQSLWYEPPWGDGFASLDSSFRIVDENDKEFAVPSHWILIAQRTNLNGTPSLKLGTGEMIDHWRTPSLSSPWIHWGASHASPGYKMLDGRTVALKGLLAYNGAAPTGTVTMFNLPAEYRPEIIRLLSAKTGGAGTMARIDVTQGGDVQIVMSHTNGTVHGASGGVGWVSLSGLTVPIS